MRHAPGQVRNALRLGSLTRFARLLVSGYWFIVFSTEFKVQSTRVFQKIWCYTRYMLAPASAAAFRRFLRLLLHQAALPLALLLVTLLDKRTLGDLELSHDPYQLVESLIHVDPQLGTALDVGDHQAAAGVLRLLQGHLLLVLQVALVAHHQHGELVAILDAQDLALELGDLIEAGMIVEREDEQESFAGAHVLLPHGTELLLASRVQN